MTQMLKSSRLGWSGVGFLCGMLMVGCAEVEPARTSNTAVSGNAARLSGAPAASLRYVEQAGPQAAAQTGDASADGVAEQKTPPEVSP